MDSALAGLGWAPEVFWKSTAHELLAVVRGREKMKALQVDAMTKDEFEAMKRRFPDANG